MKLQPVLTPAHRSPRDHEANVASSAPGVKPSFVCDIACNVLPEPIKSICKAGC